MKRMALQLVVGLAGAMLAERMHVPGGLLVGPMIAIVVIQLAGRNLGKAPRIFSETGKILLGTFVGAALNRQTLQQLGHLLLPVTVSIVAMVGVSLLLAWVLHRFGGLDLGTAVFSLTPGGMPEMVAVSEEAAVDPCAVAALQFVRMSTVLILAPVLLNWISTLEG